MMPSEAEAAEAAEAAAVAAERLGQSSPPRRLAWRLFSSRGGGGGGGAACNYLLVIGLAALWAFLTACHHASGQSFSFRDFSGGGGGGQQRRAQTRGQPDQPMDSQTFLHFLTHTRETLCGEGGDGGGSGGSSLALYNQRIGSYCREASIADRLVHSGLVNGYRMCQHMFKDERWNCTFRHQFLNTGYPQAGFVWALTVSKAVEELVMACRRGVPGLDCHCFHGNRLGGGGGGGGDKRKERKKKKNKNKKRGNSRQQLQRPRRSADRDAGDKDLKMLDPEKISEKYGNMSIPTCDDNVGHASRLVRRFFADNNKAAVAALGYHQLVNFHNRRVGHLVVKKSQTQICHCLGISGSCGKKFCIRGLKPYSRRIEANLHGLFQRSRLVQPPPPPPSQPVTSPASSSAQQRDRRAGGPASSQRARSRRRRLLMTYDPDSGRSRRVRKRSLAYTARPPSFCEPNEPAGYHGVSGRQCNNSLAMDQRGSCAHLCCGPYNYERSYRIHSDWCDCRMMYNPIRVDCRRCERQVEVHKCRLVEELGGRRRYAP